jgi:Sulfotransferase domain.
MGAEVAADACRAAPLPAIALATEFSAATALDAALDAMSDHGNASSRPGIIIAGLPRTGTTFLQQLIASRPGFDSFVGWELASSAFADRRARRPVDVPRARSEVYERYQAVHEIAPGFHQMHPLGPDEPEECTQIFRACGKFFPWSFLCPGTDLLRLMVNDFGEQSAHDHWIKAMALLSVSDATVVKSPLHSGYLSSLSSAAPAAKIVVIRRDIEDTVRSFGTMIYRIRGALIADSGPRESGHIAQVIVERLLLALMSMKSVVKDSLRIVEYSDLVSAPETVSDSIVSASAVRNTTNQACVQMRRPYDLVPSSDLGVTRDWCEGLREQAWAFCR